MEFTYSIQEKGNYNLIAVAGNLIEKGQAEHLLDDVNSLIAKESSRFVIDMSAFKYMNSTGLTVLLNILTRARKAGGEAIVCSVTDKIKSLLLITKLTNVFSVVENEETAAKEFSVKTLN